jgi:hypothetical protein
MYSNERRPDLAPVLLIAAAIVALHLATNNRYGFHRDELQVLSDARHLDWGYVVYPPLDPLLARVGMSIFGLSLIGLRLFSVLAQAGAIVFTGLAAFELGGGRMAQIGAALAVALTPLSLFEGTEFQYTTYDYLFWVMAAYFVIRLLNSEDPRWWLAIGAAIGFGLESKYTMGMLIAGVTAGVLFTGARRYLASGWLWAGVAVAVIIFLPNLIWQIRHDFISVQFLQSIHARDVRQGRTEGFFRDQFVVCANLVAAPLWIGGLIAYARSRKYRMLAWMYVVPLAILIAQKGRGYYLGSAYPMLMAMGATAGERWLAKLGRVPRRTIEIAFFGGVTSCGIFFTALVVPLADSGPLKAFALKNNGDLREEIGWKELVQETSRIWNSLTPEERQHTGILVGNYGEQGAIEILGAAHGLPMPISGTNSAWLRGYPQPPPSRLIVIGRSRKYLDRHFMNCRVAGHNGNPEGVRNEESADHPDIFVCEGMRESWAEFWKDFRSFG